MRGVNKVILVGTLGRDPEMNYANNGNAIATLSVATSEQWTDKATGQKQEKTEWHRVVIFGKLAEIAGQYLNKGSQVYLEGKLQTRKWQDQNTGQDRYSTEVVLSGFDSKMQMLGNGNRQGGDTSFASQKAQAENPGMQQNNYGQQQEGWQSNNEPSNTQNKPVPQQKYNHENGIAMNPLEFQKAQFEKNHEQFSDDDFPF